jgi:hypothetical protein
METPGFPWKDRSHAIVASVLLNFEGMNRLVF